MDTPVVQPPPPPVTPPVPPPPPKKYSGILIGILLLVIAILVGMELDETTFISNVRLYLGAKPTPVPTSLPTPSPTPDPTADWQTYIDPNLLYSFKYDETQYRVETYGETEHSKDTNIEHPKDFIDFMNYDAPIVLNAIKITHKNDPADKDGIMQLWVFKNDALLNIDQWYEKYYYYPIQWGKAIQSVIDQEKPRYDFMVHNITGKQNYLDDMGKVKLAYISKDDKMYLFYGRVIKFDEKANKEIIPNEVSLILSTFTFIEPSTTYTCPPSGYVDCMPILDAAKQKACSADAMAWYQANCPDFKGGAL